MDIRKLVLKVIPSGMKIVDFEDESIKHLPFIGFAASTNIADSRIGYGCTILEIIFNDNI